jgi:hypothetical protein
VNPTLLAERGKCSSTRCVVPLMVRSCQRHWCLGTEWSPFPACKAAAFQSQSTWCSRPPPIPLTSPDRFDLQSCMHKTEASKLLY